MDSKPRRTWIPIGSFLVALVLAGMAGPAGRALRVRMPQQQTGACQSPDVEWSRGFMFTALGTLTAERKGDNIKFTFSTFQNPETLTKNADKECVVGTKKVCIEIFSADSPRGGSKIIGKGGKAKPGEVHCGHYKAFVETPCTGGSIPQIVKHTWTYTVPGLGTFPDESRSTKAYVH